MNNNNKIMSYMIPTYYTRSKKHDVFPVECYNLYDLSSNDEPIETEWREAVSRDYEDGWRKKNVYTGQFYFGAMQIFSK